MKATCLVMSPLPTPLTCPLRSMFITSYPCSVLMEAAKRFFKQAVDVVGHAPERVTTDGHDSNPRAIRETLGSDVLHRTNRSLNNRLEQDHRGTSYLRVGSILTFQGSRACSEGALRETWILVLERFPP